MNGTAQRERHTAITELRADMEARIDDVLRAIIEQLALEQQAWTKEIAAEHAHILKVEQSVRDSWVLAESALSDCCDSRWLETGQAQKRILAAQEVLHRPTFWGRLRWLVTGA